MTACRCKSLTCGECRRTVPFPTDLPTQQRLRALRMWHWQQVVMRRGFANGKGLTKAYRDAENKAADFHLLAVQTLNDFFPAGDTAEHDAYMRASANLGQEL